jgi:hypothetical protein
MHCLFKRLNQVEPFDKLLLILIFLGASIRFWQKEFQMSAGRQAFRRMEIPMLDTLLCPARCIFADRRGIQR